MKILAAKFKTRKSFPKIVFAFLLPSIYFLFAAFAIKSQEVPTAQNFHQWGAVTLFNGLPSDNVRALTQTPDGVLWFGTDAGLAKFDGRRIETVPLENLQPGKILSLATGISGELWIGTETGAARLFNNQISSIPETAGKPISAILTGETTILVSDETIFSIHHKPDGSLSVNISDAPNLQLSTAGRHHDGNLIFGSRGHGLIVKENEFKEVISRPRPFFINVLKSDSKGNLLIGTQAKRGTSGFLQASNIAAPEIIESDLGTVNAIETTEDGNIWVGTENNGLFLFQGKKLIKIFTFENTAGGLRSNKIYSLFSDREGVLWIGTNRGACRFDPSSPFNQTISEDANANFVRTLHQTKSGEIFAGTNRGLYVFVDNQWVASDFSLSKPIYSIGEDSTGQFLIGSSTGVFAFDGKLQTPGDVRAIVNFQGKTYAAIFGRGVIRLEDQSFVFNDNSPTTVFSDEENLWIGTAKGDVFVFNGKEIKKSEPFEILRGGAIRKITKDKKNNLWLSGERGLFLYQSGELQTVIANQDVRDIAITETDVWATTLKNGLFHLRFDENFGWLISDLNVEQGLPSEQIFSLLPIGNRLLIGTNRGIVDYVPSAVAPQIVPTRVLSQKLHSGEELKSEINLEYPQNSVLVEVAGLSSRTFPEQFQYSFFLKNSEGEIVEKKFSNETQFSASGLPPGKYQIEARSFNKDLLASEPLVIMFSVSDAPFPWTATALGVLLTIAIAALIQAILERRQITQKNRELAAARFDLANEAERERKRIARDLHDQTLADLRQLMLMSDKLPGETNEFRSEVEAISTEIRRICEDLSPSVLENVGLVAALEFLLSHTIPNSKFSASESVEEKINFTSNEQMQIYRIAQEVLNNIKRHSDADFVQMEITVSPAEEFILNITDNGKFFSPQKTSARGRGIVNIKSRVALINAEADWQEQEIAGTVFKLSKQIK